MEENTFKRFIITVTTNWRGMDQEYAAVAKDASDLDDIAEELAYDNFSKFDLWNQIAREYSYDPYEMTADDWDELTASVNEQEYYRYCINEFNGTEEE